MIKHCVHLFAKCYVIAHTTKLGVSCRTDLHLQSWDPILNLTCYYHKLNDKFWIISNDKLFMNNCITSRGVNRLAFHFVIVAFINVLCNYGIYMALCLRLHLICVVG